MASVATPRDFVGALWSNIPQGYIHTKIFTPTGAGKYTPRDTFHRWPDEADALVEALNTEKGITYIGPAIRSEPASTRERVAHVAALWTTLNLNRLPFERAVEALKAFPARPSVGFLVNRVLHAVWFLSEVLGPDDFNIVWIANRTIVNRLRVPGHELHYDPLLERTNFQGAHYDFNGVIRAPGQPGTKFVAWHPEIRYTLDQFTDLVCPPESAAPAASAPVSGPASPSPAPSPPPPPPPAVEIPDDVGEKMADLLGGVWMEESNMGIPLAGMLCQAKVSEESAIEVVEKAAEAGGGNPERAAAQVKEVYQQHAEGETVQGALDLENMLGTLPKNFREKGIKSVGRVKRLIPKPPPPPTPSDDENDDGQRKRVDPNFAGVRRIKYNSRPALHVMVISMEGREIAVEGETKLIETYRQFKRLAWEEGDSTLAPISQRQWEEILDATEVEVRPAPDEATIPGMIKTELTHFLDQKKERPELGELRAYPGYDEDGEFFSWNTFKSYLRDRGVRPTDNVLTQVLGGEGWNTDRRQFGERQARVWVKKLIEGNGEGNGNGNGNGHSKSEGVDLFTGTEDPPPENPL